MITHTIRTSNNKRTTVDLTPQLAIKLFCTECCGWESNPKDCGQTICPLYPYRGKTWLSLEGHTNEDKANK